MKGTKLFVFSLFLYSCSVAQMQTLKGVVYMKDKMKLPAAVLTLHKKNNAEILAFSIADNNGQFEITFTQAGNDTLELKASLLGYTSQRFYFVTGERTTFDFILSPNEITLPEVKLNNLPVWQRKDTINYAVSAFKQQQDRVIGDIISRLPGIEITPSGQIKYQGRPINKYYIEGLDLLEDRYSIANNNIPADAVDKVQVLENHQPVRLLDSISFSNRAALNIKLKNSAKAKVISQTRLGLGSAPLLSENELVTMLFKRNSQFINSYKYNNTGVDHSRELLSHNIANYFKEIKSGSIKSDILSLSESGQPPLQKGRYLFNNSHVASFNHLIPLDSIFQLRINNSYINDYQRFENSVANIYFLPSDTISFLEQTNNKKGMNLLQTDITVMANAPRYYLKNLFRFQGWWQDDKSMVLNNGSQIDQRLDTRFFNASNDIKIIKARKRNILEWSSYSSFLVQPQQLLIYPGLYNNLLNNGSPYDAIIQKVQTKVFYTDNTISLRKRKGRLSTAIKMGFNWQDKFIKTDLYTLKANVLKNAADSFLNNLKWNRLEVYTESSMAYENGSLRLSFTLPLSFTAIYYSNSTISAIRKNGIIFNPNTSVMIQLSPKWVWESSVSYLNRRYGEAEQVAQGYILKTYRNFSGSNSPLPEQSAFDISSYFNFRDPVKTVFFSGGANYISNSSNLIYEQNFTGTLESLFARYFTNTNSSLSYFLRINKYISSWKSSLSANTSYSLSKARQLQQGFLTDFDNRNLTIGLDFTAKLNSKMTIEYNATGKKYISKSGSNKRRPPIYSSTQNISINYFPGLKWLFRLAGEYYNLKTTLAIREQNYFFADFIIRFKPPKAKIDWELIAQNLFNTKQFESAVNSNNTEVVSLYQLRPRQLLLKAGFRLN